MIAIAAIPQPLLYYPATDDDPVVKPKVIAAFTAEGPCCRVRSDPLPHIHAPCRYRRALRS